MGEKWIDDASRAQLKPLLDGMASVVELRRAEDGSENDKKLSAFLEEFAGISEKVRIGAAPEASSRFWRRPRAEVAAEGLAAKASFAGIPGGHEFTTFVLAVLQAGGREPVAAEAEKAAARSGAASGVASTFVSLDCHNCPETAQAMNALAALSPKFFHETVDGAWFKEEVEAAGVLSVPAVLVEGRMVGGGRMDLGGALKLFGARAEMPAFGEKEADMLVVGAGPAGFSAAIYAARKGLRVTVLGERAGGQIKDTAGIENYISVKATTGSALAAEMEDHARSYGVEMEFGRKALGLAKEPDGRWAAQVEGGGVIRAGSVVLATGARWRKLGVPGEEEFAGKGVAYCPHCDGPLFKGKRVAVVGGGNSGVEAALDLAGIVESVDLVEWADELKADKVLREKLEALPNARIWTGTRTVAVEGAGKVSGLRIERRSDKKADLLEVEGVFVQIGLEPCTKWLEGSGVEVNGRGEIVVDAKGATTAPGVYAAGDATDGPFKQIVTAVGSGATAALGAFEATLTRKPR